jgi:galactonate dehydratase
LGLKTMPNSLSLRRARLASVTAAGFAPAAAAGPLAIAGVRAWRLREPICARRYTVVKIEAGGLAGWGETGALAAGEIERAAGRIRGRQATEIEAVRRLLADMPKARAAVNMALLDIAGKAARAPVYQVLGGPTRFKARAMATLVGASDEELVAACRRAKQAGYRAFSVPVPAPEWPNQGQAYVLRTRKRLEAVRAETGEEMDFVLDGAGELTPGDAASLSAAFERFHLLWLDEPCRLASLAAARKLSAERVTPIGFGRRIDAPAGFQDLLREDAVDVLRPDLASTGISEIRRMAAIAETYYIAVAPFHAGGPVGTAAALQLAASLPNFFIQQAPVPADAGDRAMRAEIAGAVETVTDGFFPLPAGAGLGIEVNEAALGKYEERG